MAQKKTKKPVVERNKNHNKKISAANGNLPEVNLFSIDPKTGTPYMTHDHAEKLAYTHINRYAAKLCQKIDPEDLKQELLLKMWAMTYHPEKSAPTTFAILCMNSRCMQLYKILFLANHRKDEIPDFILNPGEGEDAMYASDHLAIEYCTPEDYMIAIDAINAGDDSGYKQYRGPRKK